MRGILLLSSGNLKIFRTDGFFLKKLENSAHIHYADMCLASILHIHDGFDGGLEHLVNVLKYKQGIGRVYPLIVESAHQCAHRNESLALDNQIIKWMQICIFLAADTGESALYPPSRQDNGKTAIGIEYATTGIAPWP